MPSHEKLEMERRPAAMASHLGETYLAGMGWGMKGSLHTRPPKQDDVLCIAQETPH